MKQSVCNMAFSTGTESKETSVKRLIGVAPVYVKAINPSKETLERIYGTKLDKEPVYTSVGKNKDGSEEFDQIRIDFIVKTDAEKCNEIEATSKVSFFVSDTFRVSTKGTIQVIDKYGRTAWVTEEQLDKHEIPMYKNGPALLDADYRKAYQGEEDLTNFIKAFLNIPTVQWIKDGEIHTIDNPAEGESRLEDIKKLINGNVKELKDIIKYQPDNKVKVCFGVKTGKENRQYQDVFIQMVLKNAVSDYSRLQTAIESRQSKGAYPNTVFETCQVKEYEMKASNIKNNTSKEAPSSDDSDDDFFDE